MAIPFTELNKLNPSSIIELFELELTVGVHIPTGNPNNLATVFRFHAGANVNSFGEISYLNNRYQRVAVKIEGFEETSSGVIPRPAMTFSNLGGITRNNEQGVPSVITFSDFLTFINDVTPNNDLLNAKVTRLLPLASSIDHRNFLPTTTDSTQSYTGERLDMDPLGLGQSSNATINIANYQTNFNSQNSFNLNVGDLVTISGDTNEHINGTHTVAHLFSLQSFRIDNISPNGTGYSQDKPVTITFGKNPFGTPSTDKLEDKVFFIDRKAVENRQVVQFELTNQLDMELKKIPARIVTRDLFPSAGRFI